MTLTQLLADLAKCPPSASLVFVAEGERIKAGYHLTEVKQARISSVDCGGRNSEWQEAVLQLLDGYGRTHMPVRKFQAILTRCLELLPDLADLPVHAEFGAANAGLRIYALTAPVEAGGQVTIRLTEKRAQCKPFADAVGCRSGTPSKPSATRCCGSL